MNNYKQRPYLFYSGILVALLGLCVTGGWILKIPALIQIHPGFVPMQFNTALCFVLSGLSFTLLWEKYDRWVLAMASLLFAISSVTMMQYLMDYNLGIDQLFMDHYITTKTAHPGRMSPNTAFCFMICGVLIFAQAYLRDFKSKKVLTQFLVVFVLGFSLVSLMGYLTGFEVTFGWQRFTRMALHTSCGFLLLSLGMLKSLYHRQERFSQSSWFPITMGLGILMGFTLIAQLLKDSENRQLLKSAHIEANLLNSQLQLLANQTFHAFQRQGDRVKYLQGFNREFWRKDAQSYYEDFQFYQAIKWLGPNGLVEAVYPVEGNEILLGRDPNTKAERRTPLRAAIEERSYRLSKRVELLQGGEGFLIFYPVFRAGEHIGTAVGEFRMEEFFSSFNELVRKEQFAYEIREDGRVIFQSPSDGKQQTFSVEMNNGMFPHWKFVFKALLSRGHSFISELTLLFGALIALGFGLSLSLYQKVLKDKERFNLFLTGVNVGIWDWPDTSKKEEFWSPKFYDLLGFKHHEIPATLDNFSKLLHPDDTERTFEMVERAFRGECSFDIEYRLKTKHHGYQWFRGTAAIQKNASQESYRMIGSIENIDVQKRAKVLLKESEEKFRTLYEDSPDAYLIMEIHGGTIIDCNAATEKMLLASKEDIIGTTPDQLSPEYQAGGEKSLDLVPKIINTVIERGVHRFEWVHKRFTGELFPCDIIISIIKYEARQVLLVGWRDMTEQKKLEAELEQFSYVVSHDLKAPLVSINGFASRLLKKSENLDERQKDYLSRIIGSAKSMERLLADLLQLSRSKRLDLNIERVDLNELVEEAKRSLSGMIEEEEAQIHSSGLITIEGDGNRLQQVFNNLIGNAIKYRHPERPPLIRIALMECPGSYEISISDNGIGIPQDMFDKVFKIFERINPEKVEGTGIGLSIVQSIIKKHKGEIRVESVEHEGSTFIFSISKYLREV